MFAVVSIHGLIISSGIQEFGQLSTRIFAPDVQHEDRGNEHQAHYQDGDWSTTRQNAFVTKRGSGDRKWDSHFDPGRVIGVEAPHTTAGGTSRSSGSTGRRPGTDFALLDRGPRC